MQTFMPYPDFKQSAVALDTKRLGKQRVENLQIMQQLLGHRLITKKMTNTGEFVVRYFDSDDMEVDIETGNSDTILYCSRDEIIIVEDMDPDEWHIEEIKRNGWTNHPAVRMWRGYESALLRYQEAICEEWVTGRGFKDTCLEKTTSLYYRVKGHRLRGNMNPSWVGWSDVNESHQSNLIRKDPEFYSKQFPGVPSDLPYVWPV